MTIGPLYAASVANCVITKMDTRQLPEAVSDTKNEQTELVTFSLETWVSHDSGQKFKGERFKLAVKGKRLMQAPRCPRGSGVIQRPDRCVLSFHNMPSNPAAGAFKL